MLLFWPPKTDGFTVRIVYGKECIRKSGKMEGRRAKKKKGKHELVMNHPKKNFG